jgi:GTPase SAR1 family protein
MVLFNHATRELTAKIVFYGPGLCGKTTNLEVLHEKLEKGMAGRLLSLSTAQDRTIYFDLLPVELGNIKGYTVRFQLATVPGQVFYNERASSCSAGSTAWCSSSTRSGRCCPTTSSPQPEGEPEGSRTRSRRCRS